MKYAFVDAHRDEFSVAEMCDHLEISRSGYYNWLDRESSEAKKVQYKLDRAIEIVFWESHNTYGSPRVHQALLRRGFDVSEDTVARRMRALSLKAITKKQFRVKTTQSSHSHKIAENILNQKFDGHKPGTVLLGDITYINTTEGFLYLAAVLDLGSRKIVGWSMSSVIDRYLTIEALDMALGRIELAPGAIFHSDRGVQYACDDYRKKLRAANLVASMSRKGNCYDNAPMESFFHSLKTEFVYHQKFETRREAMNAIFQWIETYYNRKRLHSGIGYKIPIEIWDEHMALAA